MPEPTIIPIEIRPDYFVQIMGIPHDLTAEEARKVAGVVLAMAASEDGDYRIIKVLPTRERPPLTFDEDA